MMQMNAYTSGGNQYRDLWLFREDDTVLVQVYQRIPAMGRGGKNGGGRWELVDETELSL